MRLIDIDKISKDAEWDEYYDGFISYSSAMIDEAEIVDAIPIEWIKDYIIPFQVFHDSLSEELKENDGAGWVVYVLETMLREWEKEHE